MHNLLKNVRFQQAGIYFVAVGEIYNDSKGRFADGTLITTSSLQWVDFQSGIIKTRNSEYKICMEVD